MFIDTLEFILIIKRKMKENLGNNPNSHKSFLYFISDITENLMHTSDAVSSSSSSSDESQGSSRTPTPAPPKRAPKMTPLEGFMEN
jgi:hypothetical protein